MCAITVLPYKSSCLLTLMGGMSYATSDKRIQVGFPTHCSDHYAKPIAESFQSAKQLSQTLDITSRIAPRT